MTVDRDSRESAKHESLTDSFAHFFEPQFADTAERRSLAFRVRYDVYCREFQYEREEACPGGMETDEYDDSSLHGLVVHRSSDRVAGCVRVVSRGGAGRDVLPIERHCGSTLYDPVLRPDKLASEGVCEISRLAVHGTFRRRFGETGSPLGDVSLPDIGVAARRTFPLVSVALFLFATSVVKLIGKPHVFAMMEPRLARLLKRSGLRFAPVGEIVDFRGLRAAYYIHVDDAIGGLSTDLTDLYRRITRSLQAKPIPREGFGATKNPLA